MELGQFSVSLAVKDIKKSLDFYTLLGFAPIEGCGSVTDKWLILQKDTTVIGIFEGMFEKNILTFNPKDARQIETVLKENGVNIQTATSEGTGPTHCVIEDPDGNTLMFDQF